MQVLILENKSLYLVWIKISSGMDISPVSTAKKTGKLNSFVGMFNIDTYLPRICCTFNASFEFRPPQQIKQTSALQSTIFEDKSSVYP